MSITSKAPKASFLFAQQCEGHQFHISTSGEAGNINMLFSRSDAIRLRDCLSRCIERDDQEFQVGDRVRVRPGMSVTSGKCGSISHKGGDDGSYYGIRFDGDLKEVGFSGYELELV